MVALFMDEMATSRRSLFIAGIDAELAVAAVGLVSVGYCW